MNKVSIEEVDNNYQELKSKLEKKYKEFKNEDMLITNRAGNPSYLNIFADSLYMYENGVVLLERFFKKDKANRDTVEHRVLEEKDKEKIEKFQKVAEQVIDSDLDDMNNDLVNEAQKCADELSKLTPKLISLDVFSYDNIPLLELSEAEEGFEEQMATLGVNLFFNFMYSMFWIMPEKTPISIIGIDNGDYVDVLATINHVYNISTDQTKDED